MSLHEATLHTIIEILKNRANPFVVYLFGSCAQGACRDDSDIDIGYLSDLRLDAYEVFILAQELAGVAGREVDLVDLATASTVFKAQVVGKGKIIYCTDNTRRMYFQMRALKEYALLNEERAVILNKVKKRGRIYGE
ncbi:hypothetical protein SCACP_30720 [Sporomusa carbonis]|uniref:type VII toxin-antitoxin system MntA family adenylyltransferase antitoxin n=1 Tax=Sporomusa carbonis TaxID=3076075 RepID=UPI003A76EDF3